MVIAAHFDRYWITLFQLYRLLKFLAEKNPDTQFIIFMGETADQPDGPPNMQFIDVKVSGNSNLRLHYWYNYRLPALLRKVKADIFISEAGICSNRTNVRQLLWVDNTRFLFKKAFYKEPVDRYKRKHYSRFLEKCDVILVKEEYMTGQILQHYTGSPDKFHFTGGGGFVSENDVSPLEWEARNSILETFSDGKEYFYSICNLATRANIMILLKAFSIFKKRLKSSFKLVLVMVDVSIEDCVKDFRLYKYRQDVILVDKKSADFDAQIDNAAYGAILLPSQVTGHENGLYHLSAAVPVIITDTPENRSLFKDAVLFSQLNEQLLADNMMLLYKDENKRNELIQKGLALSAGYMLPRVAERLWEVMGKL